MKLKVRPWVTRTDFALLAAGLGILLAGHWLGYLDGFLGGMMAVLALPLVLIGLPTLGLVQLLRPWLLIPRDKRLHQLWIRPVLVGFSFLCLWAVDRWSPFCYPDTSPAISGQFDATRSVMSTDNLHALRSLAVEQVKLMGPNEDWRTVPDTDIPSFLKAHTWGSPRKLEIRTHKGGVEIDAWWGGALPGYFGILIDPEDTPKEGVFESPDGSYRAFRKVLENVYLYHTNG